MKIQAYKLNSFAKSIEGGNPASIVLNADTLSENDMKKIAGILGFSDMIFLRNRLQALLTVLLLVIY
ncbi:PhzF family phenazine biosynthesis protein [Clostridium thailandense]|uniref:PhzF family phenazine biosynthesis protein n=1 Tax=Clostridium thailandense TaxID=2794346 RepID=UPI001FE29B46|nr:PhzF family phenazine biosynthesis protein [Clostridium thailandense]